MKQAGIPIGGKVSSESIKKELFPLFSVISFLTWLVTLVLSVIFNLILFRTRIRGREHLRECREACFVVSNHSLFLDPAVMILALAPRRVCMTALSQTVSTRYLGAYLRLLGCMPITEMGIRRLINRSRFLMDRGWFVQVMPEGELRHMACAPGAFREGVFYLAMLLDKPVLPYVVRQKPVRIFGRMIHPLFVNLEVEFGPVIHPSQFGVAGLADRKASRAFRDFCHKQISMMMN